MFGDPVDNNPTDPDDEDHSEDDGFLQEPPTVDDPVGGIDDFDERVGKLPWEELDDETATEIEDEVDERLCDHDEHREVVVNQEGVGASVGGIGGHTTTSVNKIVRSKCGREWDTRAGSHPGRRDPFGG